MNEDEAMSAIQAVLDAGDNDGSEAWIEGHRIGFTRFSNERITQNLSRSKYIMTVKVCFGRREATVKTTDLDEDNLIEVVRKAEEIARHSEENQEHMPPLEPVPFPEGYKVVACNSLREAHKAAGARSIFNQRLTAYEIGLMWTRKAFPEYAPQLEHLRDINAEHLGIRADQYLDMLPLEAVAQIRVSGVRYSEARGALYNARAALTDRELEVLTHLADGASNSEIGETLGISPKTVARHRENIMRKLNLHSRTELVRYAIRKGIIRP